MAGLQYNFFPTDILCPGSTSATGAGTTADQKPALPLQQYYFFPTDFLYPQSQSVQMETTRRAAAPLQIKKRDGADRTLELAASVFDSQKIETDV